MDLIDRDELYRKLDSIGGCGADKDSWADGWDCAIAEAIRLLETAPAIEDTENLKIVELHRFHEQIWVMFLVLCMLQIAVITTLWWMQQRG